MMLAAVVLLPRLLAPGADPKDAVRLPTPRVQTRPNEASATRGAWVDANGWRMIRAPGRSFVYHVTGDTAALAAAEAFTYGTDAQIAADASGTEAFGRMVDFLRRVPSADLVPAADIGIVDDGTNEMGELMNLLARQNLLYRMEKTADRSLRVNIQTGSKENPNLLAHKIRSQLGDENRSLRIYGSEVVIAHLATNSRQARVSLLNYSIRSIRGLRVRVRGVYAKGESRVFGVAGDHLEDWTVDGGATEFTVPNLGVYAVIDLWPRMDTNAHK
jgi:hypothetical protein